MIYLTEQNQKHRLRWNTKRAPCCTTYGLCHHTFVFCISSHAERHVDPEGCGQLVRRGRHEIFGVQKPTLV